MSKPCQEHEWFIPQSGSSAPHCVRCGYGPESPSAGARATPQDVDRARNQQLDQLKSNAKAHKKHIDRLTAKISQLTQERYYAEAQLGLKEQQAAFYRVELERHCDVKKVKVGGCDGYMMQESIRPPTMATVMNAWLIGFSVTAGGCTAYALAKLMGVF